MSVTSTGTDLRRAARRQPTFGTVFRLGNAAVGLVWNISTSGISMLLHESKNAGEMINGELATGDEMSILPVSIRVVHARPVQTGDFFVGAQFQTPLHADAIKPFIG